MKAPAFFVPCLVTVRAFAPVSFDFQPATTGRRSCRILYVNGGYDRDVESSEDGIVPVTQSSSLQHMPPLLALLETEDYWKEWHYSFSRNGLTDFLPQFSDHLTCCMIGNDNVVDMAGHSLSGTSQLGTQLPWQVDSDASCSITDANNGVVADPSTTTDTCLQHTRKDDDDILGKLAAATTAITEADEKGFDCILDGGVMNAVVSSLPDTVTWHSRAGPAALLELHSLMQEANASIREFGIYVAITDGPVPDHAKEYLVAMGKAMGMEWNFELDGLSNDDVCVSVARKFYTGAVNLDGDDYSGGNDGDGSNAARLLP
uniref:Uncharacterized protein n=1 Tax=Minutocellus polymorphus TaxID=265543 RepID=A0A7S0B1C9_9STRA|mmetsp:Transcript_9052/g.14981  ORF Transcript_9052/g.14981 Transcript_9052/m.14981 type:complete len:317 (+) Transcript_9052:117-1067(+)